MLQNILIFLLAILLTLLVPGGGKEQAREELNVPPPSYEVRQPEMPAPDPDPTAPENPAVGEEPAGGPAASPAAPEAPRDGQAPGDGEEPPAGENPSASGVSPGDPTPADRQDPATSQEPAAGDNLPPSDHHRAGVPTPAHPSHPSRAVVRANPTVMHAAPDSQSPPVGQLSQGDVVTVLSQDESWWQVQDQQGRVGYVRAFLLSQEVRSTGGPMVLGYFLAEAGAGEDDSLRTFYTDMTAVASWMWQVEPDGTLAADFPLSATAAALTFAGRQGLKTHALIHNFRDGAFDAGLAARILTSPRAWEELVAQLVHHARQWGLHGVQVNFENVPSEHRDAFTQFVSYLATHLRPQGLEVSVAIPARTRQTPAAWFQGYDEVALSHEVDFLVVRAFDQHRPSGPPGPIAGIDWVREVLAYLKEQGVPPGKLVLGMAAYGYDWPQDPQTQQWAEALTHRQVMERFRQARQEDPQVSLEWDETAQVPYFRYGDRVVYFENADSLSHKLALAREENLAGVALWRLNQEDPDLWAAVDFYLANWRS